ncbi:unnamed protein product [Phaeothamnion confervicola]
MRREVLSTQQQEVMESREQLSLLKRSHDKVRSAADALERNHDAVAQELELFRQAVAARDAATPAERSIARLREELAATEAQVQRRGIARERLSFMLKRLAREVLEIKKLAAGAQGRLQGTDTELASCEAQFQQSKQELRSEEDKLARLRDKVAQRRRLQEQSLAGLHTLTEERGAQLTRRDDRVRVRDEMVAQSSGMVRSDKENKLARTCVVRNVYATVLQKRVEAEAARLQELEDAFQQIRNATGLADADDIIARYLSRAQKNQQLHVMAEDIRQRIDLLRREDQQHHQLLEDLRAVTEASSVNRDMYQEVDLVDVALTSARKQCDDAQQRADRLSLTVDRLRDALARFMSRIDNKPHPTASNEKLPEVFAQLDAKISQMMKAVNAALIKEDRGPAGGAPGAGASDGKDSFSKIDSANVNKVLYHNMMATELDTSARNVRVAPARPDDSDKSKRKILLGPEYISDNEASDGDRPAGAADELRDPFVDRATIKKLSQLIVSRDIRTHGARRRRSKREERQQN